MCLFNMKNFCFLKKNSVVQLPDVVKKNTALKGVRCNDTVLKKKKKQDEN